MQADKCGAARHGRISCRAICASLPPPVVNCERIGQFAGHDDVARAEGLIALEGQAALGFQVVAQTPVAIDPDAMILRQRVGEGPIAVPMLVVDGGEGEAQGHLHGEAGSQPARKAAGDQQRDGRGDGEQIAGRSGEEDHHGAGEEDRDPAGEEKDFAVAAVAPGKQRGRRKQGGETQASRRGRARPSGTAKLVGERLETVLLKVARPAPTPGPRRW